MKKNSTTRKSSASAKSTSGKKSNGQASGKTSASKSSSTASRNGIERSKSPAKKGGSDTKESLKKMLEDLLKDTYWAEKHLTKAIPKMSKAAESAELKEAFDNHLAETEEQITRLENVFEMLGLKIAAKKCAAMEGLVEEGKEIMEEHEAGPVRDAALIIAAQKVEHYEIAAYGSMRTLAQVMGQDDAAQLLEETLGEESNTDELLTQIALRINQEAYSASDEVEDEEDSDDEDDDDEVSDVEAVDEEEEKVTETTKRRR